MAEKLSNGSGGVGSSSSLSGTPCGPQGRVLFFKSPGPDRDYVKEARRRLPRGWQRLYVNPLKFEYCGLETLAKELANIQRYCGLVLTSPRAVEAIALAMPNTQNSSESKSKPSSKFAHVPCFVVGKRTLAAARTAGFSTIIWDDDVKNSYDVAGRVCRAHASWLQRENKNISSTQGSEVPSETPVHIVGLGIEEGMATATTTSNTTTSNTTTTTSNTTTTTTSTTATRTSSIKNNSPATTNNTHGQPDGSRQSTDDRQVDSRPVPINFSLPLLILSGNRRMNHIFHALDDKDIQYTELEVYRTLEQRAEGKLGGPTQINQLPCDSEWGLSDFRPSGVVDLLSTAGAVRCDGEDRQQEDSQDGVDRGHSKVGDLTGDGASSSTCSGPTRSDGSLGSGEPRDRQDADVWCVFFSPSGVGAVLAALHSEQRSGAAVLAGLRGESARLRIATIGQTTAKGFHRRTETSVDAVAQRPCAAGVIDAIIAYYQASDRTPRAGKAGL